MKYHEAKGEAMKSVNREPIANASKTEISSMPPRGMEACPEKMK